MQFKHPQLLFALFLLLIPIIVHLFQLRKFKTEAFTNVALLKAVTIQTRKSSQLKKWLILLTRLLLLACIILAFAQPFTTKNKTVGEARETVIYLDNSFSMQKKGPDGELLKRAVQDVLSNVDEDQPLSIITNDQVFKNTTVKAIKNDVLQLEYSPAALDYNAVLLKSINLFSNASGRKDLVMVSDFQVQKTGFQPQADSLVNLQLVQLKPVNQNNVALDSLFVSDKTASNLELTVMVKNSGNPVENIPVSLHNGKTLIAKTAVNIEGQTETTFILPTNEEINGIISLEDSDLKFDNKLYFTINSKPEIKVLSINSADESFLKRLFTEDEFDHKSFTENTLDFNLIDKQNIIVLNELNSISNALKTALNAFVNNGGSLVVIPSENGDLDSYNALLAGNSISFSNYTKQEKRVTGIQYAHPLYRDVFNSKTTNFQYPKVSGFHGLTSPTATQMLRFEDGRPFLLQQGNTFTFASPLNTNGSNFQDSGLIVTLYAVAKNSLNQPELYYTIGEHNSFDVDISIEQDAVLSLVKDGANIIPQQQYSNNKVTVSTFETPEAAGIYSLQHKDNPIKNVGYNFNRNESHINYLNLEGLDGFSVSNSVKNTLQDIKNDTKINALWKWFVIFALLFLILELLLLKYLK